MLRVKRIAAMILAAALPAATACAQEASPDVPDRAHGEGPYERLILRGAILIDGTGAPPQGPVDVVVEGDRIAEIRTVGAPGLPIDEDRRPDGATREIDLSGRYLLPGFINLHSHIHSVDPERTGDFDQGVPADYVFKLQLAHGITTIRELGNGRGVEWIVDLKNRSAADAILAPRIYPFPFFDRTLPTPEAARAFVRDLAEKGAVGVKFFGAPAPILWAALDEAARQGLKTTMHHAQLDVTHANVLTTSERGLGSMEHWYGLPEALFDDRRVQDYPLDYVYQNEQHRFAEAGRLWSQAAAPGSPRWEHVMATLLERDFAIIPTFAIYMASRDWMRARRTEWHDLYTMPSLWDFFAPSRQAHGSYWFDWGTEEEVAWRENYRLWMRFINEYKNRGGKVGVGSDAGYIYSTYGFGYIQEMELLREAGFHPLEIIHSATQMGAEILGVEDEIGSVTVGKKADFVVVDENPLSNLKVLYGTGHIKLNDANEAVRVGGVALTIKNGIVYDAAELRADVRAMVAEAKAARGIAPGPMAIAPPVGGRE